MILYLTYNDQPSGVYWSQVTGVVAHLNTLGGPEVRLLALISLRGFRRNRRLIRAHSPNALVWPIVPTLHRWRSNAFLVKLACRRLRPTALMARGALATWLGLRAQEAGLVAKVCFDARGAYAAEWEEYRIVDDDTLISQFRTVEADAVAHSTLRLAVSEALVQHWRERYSYKGNEHVVVPCTLGAAHLPPHKDTEARRRTLGYGPDDIVLAYAGSTAGWQSFATVQQWLEGVLHDQPQVKVLFLAREDAAISELEAAWPGRVQRAWVKPEEVPAVLAACDQALLLRDDTLTNRVASPTKFAEYLAAGLPVLISDQIGDFPDLVEEGSLGIRLREQQPVPALTRPSRAERERLRAFALTHFTKGAYEAAYRSLLERLG